MIFWRAFLSKKTFDDPREELIESVRYHLMRLLESEAPLVVLSPKLVECGTSSFRFGIENIQSISSLMNKEQFSSQVEHWIKVFEPRISDVITEVFERDDESNAIDFSLTVRLNDDRITNEKERELAFNSQISLAHQQVSMEEQDFG